MYFLDTNTCIDFLRNLSDSVRKKFLSTSMEEIKIPVIVKAELLLGSYKSKNPSTLTKTVQLLDLFEIVPFTDEMSYTYAKIRNDLEKMGNKIGPNDLFIAATALSQNAVLVTHNTREFKRVNGLKVEDWNI